MEISFSAFLQSMGNNPALIVTVLLTLGVISVSYTHLDVYKRQEFRPGRTAMDRGSHRRFGRQLCLLRLVHILAYFHHCCGPQQYSKRGLLSVGLSE